MNTLLCSDRKHPCWPLLEEFAENNGFLLTDDLRALEGGEYLFLMSCTTVLPKAFRNLYTHALVLHESDLPKGRGWSPVAWQILEGRSRITVSLLEAEDRVDSGAIWGQTVVFFDGTELAPEITKKITRAKFDLIENALIYEPSKREQIGESSYYRRRTPEDSELNPFRSIESQFDLLRICEPRFPAFFTLRDQKYIVEIRKA